MIIKNQPTTFIRRRFRDAIEREEIEDSMLIITPGITTAKVLDRRFSNEKEKHYSITTITRVVGHIIEFSNGVSCMDKEWAAYLRNMDIPIGEHFI